MPARLIQRRRLQRTRSTGRRTTLEFLPAVWLFGDNNTNATFGYKSTLNDNDPGDMSMDACVISVVYGWHPVIEGSKRLKDE